MSGLCFIACVNSVFFSDILNYVGVSKSSWFNAFRILTLFTVAALLVF
jgi:hypothetical protein